MLLNPDGMNYTKVMFLYDYEKPENEYEFAENAFNDCKEHAELVIQHKKTGYMVSVYKNNDTTYLIQSIKGENDYYINTLYVAKEHLEDFKKIAKFLYKNTNELGKSYKKQISDIGKEFEKWQKDK